MMNRIDSFKVEDMLGYIINHTALHLKMYFIKHLKASGFDITPEQLFILFKLQEEDGQSQTQLCEKALKDKPNMTRILDLLEKRNLARRQADKEDRRKFKVFITDKGLLLIEEIIPCILECRDRLHNILTKEEEEFLRKILDKIYKNIN